MIRKMAMVIGSEVVDTVTLHSSGRITYDTSKAKPIVDIVAARNRGTVEEAFLELWDSSNGYLTFRGEL